MKIRRVLPPAAAPIWLMDLLHGFFGFFFGNYYLRRLENQLKKYFDVEHIYTLSSGKAALSIILDALKSGDNRSEVIIPAYTCYSVPSAILKSGLTIKCCDILESTLDYNYEMLDGLVSENTLCVITSNLFGIPSDIDKVKEICTKRNVFIIEDAAQAMAVMHNNVYVGTRGDVGFFSLGRGKNLSSNSGGIIVTKSDNISKNITKIYKNIPYPTLVSKVKDYIMALLMYLFIKPFLYWFPSGLSFLRLGETIFYRNFSIEKLSGVKAGLLYKWKTRLERSNNARKQHVQLYCPNHKNSFPLLRQPVIASDSFIANQIFEICQNKGLGISKMYPTSIEDIPDLDGYFQTKKSDMATSVANRLIALPTHELITARDVDQIISILNEFDNNCLFFVGCSAYYGSDRE